MTTEIELIAEAPPLRRDAHGTIRVGETRVTLETVIAAYLEGATAEEIVCQYSTLNLADVYGTIAFYLRHQNIVDAYLREQDELAEQLRETIERGRPPHELRDRLLARRTNGRR